METQDIWPGLFWIAIFTVLILRLVPKRTRIFITDYQKGVRFVKGSFVNVLGPGAYLSCKSKEEITIVDIRPLPFLIERFFYQDGLQAPSVISVGAELSVSDPYRAVTCVKDRVNDSIAIVHDTLQAYVSKTIADTAPDGRKAIAERITTSANAELSKIGMEIANLEITELWSRSVRTYPGAGAN